MKTKVVSIDEAERNFLQFIEQAHSGQEIVLTKAGKPYARLVPVKSSPWQRRPGRLNGKLSPDFFEPLSGLEA